MNASFSVFDAPSSNLLVVRSYAALYSVQTCALDMFLSTTCMFSTIYAGVYPAKSVVSSTFVRSLYTATPTLCFVQAWCRTSKSNSGISKCHPSSLPDAFDKFNIPLSASGLVQTVNLIFFGYREVSSTTHTMAKHSH